MTTSVFKVRHKPTGRWSNGKYWDPISKSENFEGKPPIGKIWNFYLDAHAHLMNFEKPWKGLKTEDFEVVEFLLVEQPEE